MWGRAMPCQLTRDRMAADLTVALGGAQAARTIVQLNVAGSVTSLIG